MYYELRKFIELCTNNNPNILELLAVPEHCVNYIHPLFRKFTVELFLSKRCELSFGNYAYSQIKKARGLEKKIVNPIARERKTILDFCCVFFEGKSIPVLKFFQKKGINQEDCGLSKLTHMRDCFSLFHNSDLNYKGIMKNSLSNEVALSSIPKGEKALAMMSFNQDGYSTYCKKYKEYWEWVEKRNEDRYATTISHGKNYDSKNLMHVFRLLNMAKEIGEEQKIHVERLDRDFLLDIKAGKFEYEDLVAKAEILKDNLTEIYENNGLPELPNKEEINSILVEVRREFYTSKSNPKK